MKLEINPNNRKYYSDDFINGFECGVDRQYEEDKKNPPKEESKERIIENIKFEIKEWYWQADKQALAKDPCVIDAMVDLFIRTIDKYKEREEEE